MNDRTRSLPADFQSRLSVLCAVLKPRTVLIVAPRGGAVFDPAAAPAGCEIETRSPESMTGETRRFDLTLVFGAVETLGRQEAVELLARLRDFNSRNLVLAVDAAAAEGAEWRNGDWLAMGMRRLDAEDARGEGYRVYGFSIADYKVTPDWLNSRFWAHPERFGKARW